MDALDTSSKPTTDKNTKLALCVWISICVVGFVWFISKVMNGRRQIRYNFQNIEEQLKKIQDSIERAEKLEAEQKQEAIEDVKDEVDKKED